MRPGIQIDYSELTIAINKLDPILEFEPDELMSSVGALGETQTRRRITSEKTAPDGTPWEPNAEGSSILQRTGSNLLDSVAHTFSSSEAAWGVGWEFAHVHQDGMTIHAKSADRMVFKIGGRTVAAKSVKIPARPMVGLSSENKDELDDLITDFFSVGGLN